ncbi:MAG TPA: DUF134 domain-containing protein [Syntrophomonadaceae bacterium]|nr:DUF134 domain-containing protein [Syntrophomonadaceae bacterium]HHW29817.1 DUF134 domain-containing protein [Syntrophomonadaceae bacterium]
MVIPRKRRKCCVESLPPVTYYKPAGIPLRELDEVKLTVEEFEALRLKDLEGLEQIECAEKMGVARTTFQRVLYAARAKIAEALVNGKALRIEGGAYIVATEKYRCSNCGREFAVHPVIKDSQLCCPDCGKNYVQRGDFQRGPGHKNGSCRRDSVIVSADRKEGPDDSEPKE